MIYNTTSLVSLLEKLIATPSFSKEETGTAALLEDFFTTLEIPISRKGNNIWALSKYWKPQFPVILLNSHHDTVRPVAGWQRPPFEAIQEGDHLYGLGSNDAGGSLIALIGCFLHLYESQHLPYNLILAATAEEEISGKAGIASILEDLPPIFGGIVGEPTSLRMAVAERGLVVIDGEATGKAGHAARDEGINALYIALEDIDKLRHFHFKKVSPFLGPVKVSITQINAGTQHNVVPDKCSFVMDVRTNELYSNAEIVEMLQKQVRSKLTPRSLRLNSSRIAEHHPLVQSGRAAGLEAYGSPTLSDQALLPFPTIKLGPGDSARSHTADEFILVSEIEAGIKTYLELLSELSKILGA